MIVERALDLAGDGAVLVTRPAGVPHVYVGPLTPSGRFAAAAGQTVCRARTRRLTVIHQPERWSSLDPDAGRLCARCSARLSRSQGGTDGPEPCHRDEWRRAWSATSRADIAAALLLATDLEEVAAAAHLTLLLFDYSECVEPFEDRGRRWPPLNALVQAARGRLATDEQRVAAAEQNAALVDANEAAARDRRESWQDREDRIKRLGFRNATDREPHRRSTRTT